MLQASELFIQRWSGLDGGQERANYALFLSELCDLIGVERPDPARRAHEENDYVFERRVERRLADGTLESGRIDLYKRGCFILEAKQSAKRSGRVSPRSGDQGDLFAARAPHEPSPVLDHVMIGARRQAERYALSLPADHAYPPFIIACDVGRAIELYADFSGHGRHYAQFPDPRSYRIELEDFGSEEVRERLRAVWRAPASLDPALRSARVTREIAQALAELSRALEARGFSPRPVALFLMRCLFTMFVEDIGLLKKRGFTQILARCLREGAHFVFEIGDLWRRMDVGAYSPALGEQVLRFNGKLFKNAEPLPLAQEEIALLHAASLADWQDLEPAIFGTLFEQALDPVERRRLGAHYTPRAYVEIVVDATIMEPLGRDWAVAQLAAYEAMQDGSRTLAASAVETFLRDLASVVVLDPACGTGNFLYVALRRMKQLEGEAVALLREIAGFQTTADPPASVRPSQFVGLETNARAVEIAELVLWIGSIQWHMRTHGSAPPEPIVGNADHILSRDALLLWDGCPDTVLKRDATGRPVTDTEGREIALYPNPRRPNWPAADFIVGNPPFVGGKDIRSRLGASYAKALGKAHPAVAPSADVVMHWWDRAADLLRQNGTRLRRFGFVTTNSIVQPFQRRVVERHLRAPDPVSLILAIPDHPWTKATRDAAAVRIAMTVAERGSREGTLRRVVSEAALDTDEPRIAFVSRRGRINADLTVGADVGETGPLRANEGLCHRGVQLMGSGFIVTRRTARDLGLGRRPGLERHLREYRNGKDHTARSRDVLVIDLFGLTAEETRRDFPEVYQHVLALVKPERERNARASYRDRWWQFGEPRKELRTALQGLRRYIATVETAKHRVFQFLDAGVMPDNMIVAVASDDPFHLGVLGSRFHSEWALRAGGRQGVGNDPRYTKSRCFDPFPFPEAPLATRARIAAIAEEIDGTRKRVLAEHPDLTLTAIYNAVEGARTGGTLAARDLDHRRRGRALILLELHADLDRAVAAAYGWPADLDAEAIVQRLVALNAERSAEERRGFVRWLREDYQVARAGPLAHRADRVRSLASAVGTRPPVAPARDEAVRGGWILDIVERAGAPIEVEALAETLASAGEDVASLRRSIAGFVATGSLTRLEDGRLDRTGT